jgi:hypothetical protein
LPCHVFFLFEHAVALSEKSGRKRRMRKLNRKATKT